MRKCVVVLVSVLVASCAGIPEVMDPPGGCGPRSGEICGTVMYIKGACEYVEPQACTEPVNCGAKVCRTVDDCIPADNITGKEIVCFRGSCVVGHVSYDEGVPFAVCPAN